MPYLRQLVFREAEGQPHVTTRGESHHVVELLLLELGSKFDLNGTTMLTVSAGPFDSETSSVCAAQGQVLGCSWIHLPDFPFDAYARSSRRGKSELVLTSLERAMLVVATAAGRSGDVLAELRAACERVRAANFKREVEIKKLRKGGGGRPRVRVLRELSEDLGEAWTAVLERSGREPEKLTMHDLPCTLNRSDVFRRATIDGGSYRVTDSLGELSFSVVLESGEAAGPAWLRSSPPREGPECLGLSQDERTGSA